MSDNLAPVLEATLESQGPYSLAARLFPNLESYPGQLRWTPPRLSAKQENKISRKDAVRAIRQVERTNEHIRGGIDRNVDMVVGAKLIVNPTPDWETLGIQDTEVRKEFVKACRRAFTNWGYDSRNLCDAEGDLNFGGLMWLSYRNVRGPDAETFGIIHYDRKRRAKYATPWATFVQVLDPDRIDTPPEYVSDNMVDQGIRRDEHGRRLGFYCQKQHPAEGWSGTDEQFKFIPRETWWGRAMSWHWFQKTRGSQPRGLSSLITILKSAIKLNAVDDNHIGAAALAALLAISIQTEATPELAAEMMAPAAAGPSLFDNKVDYYGRAKIKIGEQRVPVLPPGDKINMESVQRSIADPTSFRNNFLRQFALALNISFEQLSNNFSDANYSSARAALLEVWRTVTSLRTMFTSHVASLIYGSVIEEAIEIGAVVLPPGAPPFQENRAAYTSCSWTGPGMGWIDPLKEANAMLVRLQSKTSTREKEIAANGDDWIDIFDQIELEEHEAAERNFSLEVKPSAAALPADGGPEDASSKDKKRKNAPGDGDGDGIPNETQEA